jgi:hypothetical protein
VLLLLTFAAGMKAEPAALSATVAVLQSACGAAQQYEFGSVTVTIAVQLLDKPLTSVTVSVTVLAPKLEQWNEVALRDRAAMPQLSEELLSISAAASVAVRPMGICSATGLQSAVGASWSATITIAVHEVVFPCPSLAVNVTVLAPRLAQVNELGVTSPAFTVPQLSLEAAAFRI